jgi:hypothetical protein
MPNKQPAGLARAKSLRREGKQLLGFLHGLEMSFERLAVFMFCFQLGLQFLDEQLEAANFVALLLQIG